MDIDQKDGKRNPRAFVQSDDQVAVGGAGDV